jgi:hypothetical protein
MCFGMRFRRRKPISLRHSCGDTAKFHHQCSRCELLSHRCRSKNAEACAGHRTGGTRNDMGPQGFRKRNAPSLFFWAEAACIKIAREMMPMSAAGQTLHFCSHKPTSRRRSPHHAALNAHTSFALAVAGGSHGRANRRNCRKKNGVIMTAYVLGQLTFTHRPTYNRYQDRFMDVLRRFERRLLAGRRASKGNRGPMEWRESRALFVSR